MKLIEPKIKRFRIKYKDSSRVYWNILVKFDCCEQSKSEKDFYESLWYVNVFNEYSPKKSIITSLISTQYDEYPDKSDVMSAVSSYIFHLCMGIVEYSKMEEENKENQGC